LSNGGLCRGYLHHRFAHRNVLRKLSIKDQLRFEKKPAQA
jgi:hypothetical protein